jgi:hypothetical protein
MTYMYGYPDNYVFSLKNIIPEQISPCDIIEADQSWQRYSKPHHQKKRRTPGVCCTSYKKKQTCILYMYGYPFYFLFFDNSLLEKHFLIDFSFFGDRISCNLLGRSRRSRQGRSHNCCNRPWSFDHI